LKEEKLHLNDDLLKHLTFLEHGPKFIYKEMNIILKNWSKNKTRFVNLKPSGTFSSIIEKIFKTKFKYKKDKLSMKLRALYTENLKQVKANCGNDIENCELYKQCAGTGDRMNTQRGAPDKNMNFAYSEFSRVRF